KERARLSASVAFSMRVAASILVLISVSYIALHLLSRASEQKPTQWSAGNPAGARRHDWRRPTEPPTATAALPKLAIAASKPAATLPLRREKMAQLAPKVEVAEE